MARERTALSWRRTAVSSMGTAALFINHAISSGWRYSAVAPLVATLMLAVLAVVSFQRGRALRRGEDRRTGLAVTATTVVIGLVCAVSLFIGLYDSVR
jgi:uncharacterized membrane protein YidH (DUF202 family)